MNSKENVRDQAKDTGMALVLLFLLGRLWSGNERLIVPAVAVLVLNMTWPMAFRPLARLWFGLSELLGKLTSKLLLSLVFFLVATPVGFFRRLGGKDAMRFNGYKKGDGSVFESRHHPFTASDLEKPY